MATIQGEHIVIAMVLVLLLPERSLCQLKQYNEDRANVFWKKYFCSEWSNLPRKQGLNVYKSDRIAQNRTLIGSCSVDIGTCPIDSCSTNNVISFFNCSSDGFYCARAETRTKDCGVDGFREYQYVLGCDCCKSKGIHIETIVTDSKTNIPLRDIKLTAPGRILGATDTKGNFTFNVEHGRTSIVLEAVDNSSLYMNAVKKMSIPSEFTGPFKIYIKMLRKPESIMLKPSSISKLSLSKNITDPTSISSIVLNTSSFTDIMGRSYTGPVNASITFVDPTLDPPETVPGVFITKVGNVTENLISDGMFALEFKDEHANDLISGPVKVSVREGMQLWNLNKETGLWETMEVSRRRSKRQVGGREEFTINVTNRNWINIDRIAQAPKCYFKARIYAEDTGAEIRTSKTTLYKPEITGITPQKQHIRLYADFTKRPYETCYEVRCPNSNDRFEAHSGFINMSSLQIVSVAGQQISYTQHLMPFDITLYDVTRPYLERLNYTVTRNKLDLFVNFISSDTGPFYNNKRTCEHSPHGSPSFNFFEPIPPKYEPEPEVQDMCAARIALADHWNFYNYMAGMTQLPLIKAVSVWTGFGREMIYTDSAQIEASTSGRDYVLSACVKYRCSNPGDPTVVYLDIDVPNTADSYEKINSNGFSEVVTFSVPAFHCEGECIGPLCTNTGIDVNGTSIDGSFVAEIKSGQELEFNTCKGVNSVKKYDYTFVCNSREGLPQK